jgi:hypothetical protein
MSNIRQEILDFASQGSFPSSESTDEIVVTRMTEALLRIQPPVTRDEAILLASSFGPDEYFGLAWTLVHLIESASGGVPFDALPEEVRKNEWVRLMEERARK